MGEELALKDEEWKRRLCELEERHAQELGAQAQKSDDLMLEKYQRSKEHESEISVKDMEQKDILRKKEEYYQEIIQSHEETIQKLFTQIAELSDKGGKPEDGHKGTFMRMLHMPKISKGSADRR